MTSIAFSSDLAALGYSPDEISRMVRSGKLVPIRRGAFRTTPELGDHSARTRHRELIEATIRQCSTDAVVSHMSAAVLHGLPLWTSQLDRVQLIRDRAGGGRTRRYVQIRGLPLEADEIQLIDGIAVTSLARTILDLACQLPMDQAVAVGDAALRLGLSVAELDRVMDRAGPRHGIGAARRAVALLDGRSETVGESRSRVLFHQHRLPKPELQFQVLGPDGRVVARTDFGWPDFSTVGEFDGKVKYQRALRPGHDPEEELFREKRREDAVRDLDLGMVRWITADIDQPAPLLSRLERAFRRGRRAA